MKRILVAISVLVLQILQSCIEHKSQEPFDLSAEDLHASFDKVTKVMVHDIFSPPVASRVYVYPHIAVYEVVALNNDRYLSLSGQLTDMPPIPGPNSEQKLDYRASALVAHLELSKRLVFSEDSIVSFRDSIYAVWKDKDELGFEAAKRYGMKVADHIGRWMDGDNYRQTRTMPKYTVDSENPSRWQPTPPAYMEGIEPHWDKIRPFVLDSAYQFKPEPPPSFSLETDSDFYRELLEVYDISNKITKKGDSSEEVQIAKFWDCNPYVSVTKGHLMFATKKISPGAHWMGITKIAAKKTNSDFDETAYAYAKTSIAIADAFISCWAEKAA